VKINTIENLKIYNGFIDNYDIPNYIALIDRLEPDAIKTGEAINWTPEHLRIYNPKDVEAKEFAIKYGERFLEQYDLDLNIHIVGFLKYYEGGSLPVHTDIIDGGTCQECKVGAVAYFNDDYTGGEFIIPELTDQQFHLEAGGAVSYPADDTKYNHGVNTVTSGIRYALCYCFTTNKNKYPYA
jgi:hypothetical protein